MGYTVTYDEKVKGFTSFHSWEPEWMMGLNNTFYTIKNGQLYKHNIDNGVRNNFYGVQYDSQIETVFNEAPSDDKIFKTIVLESNKSWAVTLTTNYTNSTINKDEFNSRESRWFSYVRRNESATDLTSVSQGIGNITIEVGTTITFGVAPQNVSIGDELYQMNGSTQELVGTVTAMSGSSITVNAITTTPVVGYFAFCKKNGRVEGSQIRGYFATIRLVSDDTDPVELFAVNSNIVKSYL